MDAQHFTRQNYYPFSLFEIFPILCVGIVAAVLSPLLPAQMYLFLLLMPAIYACFTRYKCCVMLGFFLVGYCWSAFICQQAVDGWLPIEQENRDIEITGYVMDFPQKRERGWQFDFYAEELGGKIRLSVYDQYSRSTGDTEDDTEAPRFDCHYRLQARLKRPRGLLNFGLYDYQAWLLQSGYLATGYIRKIEDCATSNGSIALPAPLLGLRVVIANHIKAVPMSDAAKSTLLALLIGSYADIDQMQWQILRDSGTIHLLSVSGLHIVLVAALAHFIVFHICRLLVVPVRYWPADFYGAIAALLVAICYAYLAGFSVATQRSLIMVAVAVFQRLLYGRFQFGSALLAALVLILFSNPLSIMSSGFWFSFWATAVLIFSSRKSVSAIIQSVDGLSSANAYTNKMRVAAQWLIEAVRPQWLVFVMLAPMLLYVYGRMPLLSLPLNFFAVPWVSFISLPLAFAALALLPVSDLLSGWLLQFSAWTLDVYWSLMQWGVAFGKNWYLTIGGVSLWQLTLSLVGLWLLFVQEKQLWLRAIGFILCAPLIFLGGYTLHAKEAEITVLDVGQGLSVIVRTAKHILVYDTGDKRSERFDAGRDIVAPALRHLRVGTINMLMLSHGDSDHAGGAPGLMQEFSARQLWSGTPEQLVFSDQFLQCRAGMHWKWDGVDFRVLHPSTRDADDEADNNRGCVLMVNTGSQRLLLTADIERAAEEALLQGAADLHADILISPHHGSKSSSSAAFLEAVDASVAVISSGFHNRYRHPSPEVVRRYQQRNMQILNTAETGAVRFRLLQQGMQIDTAVCEHAYFWRQSNCL